MSTMCASIVINNYNYGRYIADAIDSSLAQTWRSTEVIVVDDGSTDDSRDIISGYAGKVQIVFKENGGQASALNAGFAHSTGEVVLFLDSDDMLKADALARAVPCFSDRSLVKVHWPLLEVDTSGRSLGRLTPVMEIPDGDLRHRVFRDGPATIAWPPTSGNAWSRSFLKEVFPVDEHVYRIGADSYLFELAPFFGLVKTLSEPLTYYRRHAQSHSQGMTFAERLQLEFAFSAHYFPLLEELCRRKLGVEVDTAKWKEHSWWHRLAEAASEIRRYLPSGERFALIDGSAWAMDCCDGRTAVPFPEKDGVFAGPPADGAGACREMDGVRSKGVRFIVIGWPAFWWLDYYADLRAYIETRCRVLHRDSRVIILQFA